MSTMFEIVGDAQELYALFQELQENEQMTDEEQTAILRTWLGETEAAFESKIDAYVAVYRNFLAMEETAKKEAARLADRAKSFANNADRLKETMKFAMEQLGITSKKTACNTVNIQANGGNPPIQIDEEKLPKSYFTNPAPVPDRRMIQDAIKGGLEIAGVTVLERGKSLRIR